MKISFDRREVLDLLRSRGLEVRKISNTKMNAGKKPSLVLAELLNDEMLRRAELADHRLSQQKEA
jgi:hypothetical protein